MLAWMHDILCFQISFCGKPRTILGDINTCVIRMSSDTYIVRSRMSSTSVSHPYSYVLHIYVILSVCTLHPYVIPIHMSSASLCHTYVLRICKSAYVCHPHPYVIRIRMSSASVCDPYTYVIHIIMFSVSHTYAYVIPHRNVHRYVPIRNTVLAHRCRLDHWS